MTYDEIKTKLGITENSTIDELIEMLVITSDRERNLLKRETVLTSGDVVKNKAEELKKKFTNTVLHEEYGALALADIRYTVLKELLTKMNIEFTDRVDGLEPKENEYTLFYDETENKYVISQNPNARILNNIEDRALFVSVTKDRNGQDSDYTFSEPLNQVLVDINNSINSKLNISDFATQKASLQEEFNEKLSAVENELTQEINSGLTGLGQGLTFVDNKADMNIRNIGTLREDTNMNTALINTKVNQTDYDTFKSQVDSYHAQHTTEYNYLNGKVNSILEGSSIDADSFKEVVDIINNADANLVNQIAQKVNTSDIVNDLHSLDTNKPLSAYQGKVLNDSVESLQFSVSDLRDMDSELRNSISDLSTSVDERISVIKDETIPSMQSQIEQNRIDAQDAYNYASDNDSWLNNLQNQVNSLSDQINITYAELKVLRDTSNLEIGKKYRITDFVTTCAIQRDCQSAGHPFDIIVTANDINVLDENASAICHSGDTYFAESKLESWNIKYCLDNDRRRFNWADETNGKGVIWYMKDQFNNECYYDFKNIQYKRWNILSVNDAKNSIFVDNKFYYGNYDIYGEEGNSQIIEGEYGEFKWVYTFHNVYDDSDLSLKNLLSKEYVDYLEYEYGEPTDWFAHDNSIGSNHHQYYEEYDSDYNGESMSLPNNVFYGEAYFLDDYSDICVTGIHGNKLGVNCYSNTFGNYCYYNTFGNYCYYNTFGNYCNSNTFGNYCHSNTFGNSCNSNTFGNSCHSNTFGNSCHSNTFGNYCYYNTFGNYCYSNTFGNYCYSNKIFNDVLQTSINSYARWNIFENGVTYVTLQSSTGGAYNSQLQNVKICQGVKGASSSNRKVINVSRNLPYQYEVKAVNSVTSEV